MTRDPGQALSHVARRGGAMAATQLRKVEETAPTSGFRRRYR
ncbi:hypothetical protein [Streptomyces echinatus]